MVIRIVKENAISGRAFLISLPLFSSTKLIMIITANPHKEPVRRGMQIAAARYHNLVNG